MIPARVAGLVEEELDGETVVWDPATRHLHHLDGPATVVWGLVDGVMSTSEMALAIAQAFAAPEAVVLTDVGRLIEQLGAQGLVE